jgi:uncharacterized protein (TIGR03492 family)
VILFISNGTGEDMFGAAIARRIGPSVPKKALPLVGVGKPYEGHASCVGPLVSMPSNGFIFNSWANLWGDLRAGFISMSLRQWETAIAEGGRAKAVVVVGDAYALAIGVWLARTRPLYYLNPLVSVFYTQNQTLQDRLGRLNEWGADDFTVFERSLYRYAHKVFVRDEPSAQRLHGLGHDQVHYWGSFAMDVLEPLTNDLGTISGGNPVLALLPGSRADANFSLGIMLEAAALVPDYTAIVAWAKPIGEVEPPAGWALEPKSNSHTVAHKAGARVHIFNGAFSEIVHAAHAVVGTAGTANEQAAGLGKPVVGFATPGPQYTRGFALRQKRLLGDALELSQADPAAIAKAIGSICNHPERYQLMSQAGQTRIGKAGALPRIAREIESLLVK